MLMNMYITTVPLNPKNDFPKLLLMHTEVYLSQH